MVAVLANRDVELSALCARFGVRRLEVFGSAATEDEFDPESSDIDMIVEFRHGQDLGPWLANYFSLREGLSKLFGYPVDLVMSSAMKNPHFIREANRTRKLLYASEEPQAT
jgi:predicted nucleotidyltransferase